MDTPTFDFSKLKGLYQFRKPIPFPRGVEYLSLDDMMVAFTTALNRVIIEATRSAEEKGYTVDYVQTRWVNIALDGFQGVHVELIAHSDEYKGTLPIRPIWEVATCTEDATRFRKDHCPTCLCLYEHEDPDQSCKCQPTE